MHKMHTLFLEAINKRFFQERLLQKYKLQNEGKPLAALNK